MKIFSPVLKGTTVSDGTSNLSGSFTGSLSGTATTASNANTASYVVSSQTDTQQNTRLNTIEAVTGSYALTSSFGAYTSSNDTTNTTQNARLLSNEQKTGSFATTGSNYFIGNQVITGSVYIANDLIVQGSSSLQNITASAVSIGTNTVILNTDTPILRFGGISVQDSGSTQGRSGSLFWDSVHDHWIYVVPSGSSEGYNSAMLMNGPKNTGSLGDEVGLTANYIPVAQGEDHITDSIIFQSGSTNIGIGTTSPASLLDVAGDARFGDGNNFNPLIQFAGSGRVQTSPGYSFVGDLDTGMFNPNTGNTLAFTTSGSERIRINSSGNVGIGTTNPSFQLDLGGGTTVNTRLRLQRGSDDTNQYGVYGWNQINLYRANVALSSAQTDFSINQVGSDGTRTSFYVSSTGNIGIGVTSPLSKLDISTSATEALCVGNASGTITSGDLIGALSFVSRDGSTYSSGGVANIRSYATQTYNTGNVAADLRFYVSNGLQNTTAAAVFGTEAMRITNEGKVGIGTTSPLRNLHVYADDANGIGIGKNLTDANLSANLYFYPSSVLSDKRNWGITTYYDRTELLQFRRSSTTTSDPYNSGVTVMTLDGKNDRVGIGTISPIAPLHIYSFDQNLASDAATSYTYAKFRLEPFNTSSVGLSMGIISPNINYIQTSYSNGTSAPLTINPYGGNVTIGQTSPNGNANGIYLRPGIESGFIVTSDVALQLSRLSTTGDIQTFYSGTTRVGKIAVGSSTVTFESSTNGGLTVNSAGNIGVGTSTPTHNLHVNSSLRVNRTVYSWYKASWQGNGTYWHMKTNLYAGAAGNTQYTMSFFKAFMYSYSSAAVYEGSYGFHNWNGILYNAASAGNIGFSGYISSDGYVVLVVISGSGETGVTIDWHQTYDDYPFISSSVTAAGLHGSTTGKY